MSEMKQQQAKREQELQKLLEEKQKEIDKIRKSES